MQVAAWIIPLALAFPLSSTCQDNLSILLCVKYDPNSAIFWITILLLYFQVSKCRWCVLLFVQCVIQCFFDCRREAGIVAVINAQPPVRAYNTWAAIKNEFFNSPLVYLFVHFLLVPVIEVLPM